MNLKLALLVTMEIPWITHVNFVHWVITAPEEKPIQEHVKLVNSLLQLALRPVLFVPQGTSLRL
jgi:hypothetical protein